MSPGLAFGKIERKTQCSDDFGEADGILGDSGSESLHGVAWSPGIVVGIPQKDLIDQCLSGISGSPIPAVAARIGDP
jgi:hypothetical protein